MSLKSGRIASFFASLEYHALEISLLVLLALNGISVFTRYILNHAVGELFEVMILLSVATYWLGVATAERLGGHLGMDFAVAALPPALRRVADLLRKAVILGFLAVVIYSGTNLVRSQIRFGTSSSLLDMPTWMFSIFVPFGCTLLAFRTVFPPRRPRQQSEPPL